ncbi:MAG: TIGR03862 family flavoprotein [Verrucomicrobiota bacterium]|nr:TIGR03862 family flavoprotein [Verrucomicrobiota bacterium]
MIDADVLVIGGGPAGLRAAEVARDAGAKVILCDGQRSVGRKFLIAGRGGLNLTHGEPAENFPLRYREHPERWQDLLGEFGPDDLRGWAEDLGVESYVGTSGRVFPRGQKAAILLRAWVRRLRAQGVQFRMDARLSGFVRHSERWQVQFEKHSLGAKALVFALGGASWPETGSDGSWPALFHRHGIAIAPWQPANSGWEVDWPEGFLERAEGKPLKNLVVRAGDESVSGELLITRYGIEGGAIYRLGPILRAMAQPEIEIDLKPQLSPETVRTRLTSGSVKLNEAAQALLEFFPNMEIKKFRLRLRGPRPIEEAISSAGGVRWEELDDDLMLRKLPGVFVAGEMIDWEAPTGGYLLQGCFSTGTRAGRCAAQFAAA